MLYNLRLNISDFDKCERTFENVNFSMKNTQTSQQHTNASKYLKNVSDTALESLNIILSLTNNFGYYTGKELCPLAGCSVP